MLQFLISGWLTISTLIILINDNQVVWKPSLSFSLFLIEYNEEAGNNHNSMLDINNYLIEDRNGSQLRIDSIGIVAGIVDADYGVIDTLKPSYTTVVALKTERVKYKTEYLIIIQNIHNKAGQLQPPDTSYFFYNGYHPNLIEIPQAEWGKTKQ